MPPPSATLYKDSDEMSRMAAHRPGTVLDWPRPGLSCVVIVANTRRPCRSLPSEPPSNRSIGAEELAGHTRASGNSCPRIDRARAVGNFDANPWARCQIRRRPRQGTTGPSSTHATAINQGRTASLIAATSSATFDTDSVMPSSMAMATASRNGITRRSKNSSSSEARGSAARSSPM